ncbi:MAG TPA: LuxR C-terminal-related transcriptional regulator [Anaerolineae bacterium]
MREQVSMNGEQRLHALVVDDDPRWRALVSEILSDAGCLVTALAEPPTTAERYHLAVLDVTLKPDEADNRDGLALMDRLPGARIVYLTGIDTGELVGAIEQHPAVMGWISKAAFRREVLLDFVRQVAASVAESSSTAHVLIVEDDPGWRGIYSELLTDAGYVPHFAVSYAEARGHLQRAEFALAIVDLHLISSADPQDNRDGFWFLRVAHQRSLPTIVVSALGVPEDIDRAYEEFGVFTFIEKEGFDRQAFRRTVAEAIRSQPAETTVEPTPAITATPASEVLNVLTDREREVLALMARGYTNRQIANELRITTNTVKKHVDHILQKLDVSNRAGAVAAALRIGLTDL